MAKPTTNSIVPIISELEKLYDQLTALDWPDPAAMADRPVINVMPAGRKRFLGWFDTKGWMNGDGKTVVPEINLAAEHLLRGREDIVETMAHEMAHYANFRAGIKDCSGNQRHNMKFKAMCDRVGLECEKDDRYGWAFTKLGTELKREVKRIKVDWKVFKRKAGHEKKDKQTTRMHKWTCGCTVVRCATELMAVCGACGSEFAQEQKEEN